MMKKNTILILGSFLLASCTTSIDKKFPSIGGSKDRNGCLVGAGQTWSQLNKKCIQVFNDGIRLNPINKGNDDTVISAFIVYNKDQSQAELFLPDLENNPILTKNNNGDFVKDNYKYYIKSNSLYINGIEAYKKQ